MSRFKKEFRDCFANRVTKHFDKYCEITNPVKFDALHDIYKEAFTSREWSAMDILLGTSLGQECLEASDSFILNLPSASGDIHGQRRVTFGFSDGIKRPCLNLEYSELNADTQAKLDMWVKKTLNLKILRQELWHRCDRLLDWGWERNRSYGANGWYGGPEPGQGCNTPGQVYRIWPELLPFLPVDDRGNVRNASVKSRLPDVIIGYGTVEQFLCKQHSYNDEGEEQSDEELAFARRKFDALTHILVQMSLVIDVPRVRGYPSIY